MDDLEYSFGADKSPFDLRTFTYDKASLAVPNTVGESWEGTEFIDDQHRVGICTAISMTMRAHKHFNKRFSPDFQYLLQKKFIDGNWREGSSAFSACKVGNKYGFLPLEEWKHTTENDRKKRYSDYIEMLQDISDEEIDRLLEISKDYKIKAYAKVPTNIYSLAGAIEEGGSIISRFVVGREWWTSPVEPLKSSANPISGHLVNITKRVGDSYRIANSWGKNWVQGGTAYGLFATYPPTEMWQIWFEDVPSEIEKKKEQLKGLQGKLLTLLQKYVIELTKQLKK